MTIGLGPGGWREPGLDDYRVPHRSHSKQLVGRVQAWVCLDAMAEARETEIVRQVRAKAHELEELLNDFSDRLRRMRQRNRQLEAEIASFEEDLDRLRRDVLDARKDLT